METADQRHGPRMIAADLPRFKINANAVLRRWFSPAACRHTGRLMDCLYLDHNATSPVLPEVARAVADCLRRVPGNPASQHAVARRARQVLEAARRRIGELLGAQTDGRGADRLVFTSGGTESNNLALRGLAGDRPGHALVSAIEHPSVSRTADWLATHGWQIERVAVTAQGVVDVDDFRRRLRPGQTRWASIQWANNETGVLQPVAELAALCRQHGVCLHSDAVQAVGRIAVDFRTAGIAAMSFTGHKLGGPPGIGGLLLRGEVELSPLHFGGFQQGGLRPGTEPVALAVGLQTALEAWLADGGALSAGIATRREDLEQRLLAGWPEAVIVGRDAPRLPHTTCIAFPGLDRQALVMALDLAGVACSTGSACASSSSQPSPTLLAMGLPRGVIEGAIRLSLGPATSRADIRAAAERILAVCNNLQKRFGRPKSSRPPRSEGPVAI